MAENRQRTEVAEELQAALEADDNAEKNYHVRQALQLLELDDSTPESGRRP